MRAGGLGIGGLLVLLVLSWATGVDFLSLLGGGGGGAADRVGRHVRHGRDVRRRKRSSSTSSTRSWTTRRRPGGELLGDRYQPTKARLFRDAIQSALRLRAVGERAVLLSRRSLRLSRSRVLRRAAPAVRRVRRFRPGVRARARTRASRAVAARHRLARCASSRRSNPSGATSCRCGSNCRRTASPACGRTPRTSRAVRRRDGWSSKRRRSRGRPARRGSDRRRSHPADVDGPRVPREIHARHVGAARDVASPRLRKRRPGRVQDVPVADLSAPPECGSNGQPDGARRRLSALPARCRQATSNSLPCASRDDTANDGSSPRCGWRGNDQAFREQDTNADGVLSGEEVQRRVGQTARSNRQNRADLSARLRAMDTDNDGVITRAEWREQRASRSASRRQRDGRASGDEVRVRAGQAADPQIATGASR